MPDRVRESLFGLLRGHCDGAVVYDGFAGTGAIGLEALSRGARWCVFVERDRAMVSVLQANVRALGVASRCEIVPADVLGPAALACCPQGVDLVFLDPPYELTRSGAGWSRMQAQMARFTARLARDGFLVVRTPWPMRWEGSAGSGWLAVAGALGPETHVYGTTAVHLYAPAGA